MPPHTLNAAACAHISRSCRRTRRGVKQNPCSEPLHLRIN